MTDFMTDFICFRFRHDTQQRFCTTWTDKYPAITMQLNIHIGYSSFYLWIIHDLCLGYKLPGAGGGGYLYMVAKDPEAAARIRQVLTVNALNANARFVNMTLSRQGLQVSRS